MSNHIQVELDALNHAHTIAVAARIGPEWVVYGLNMMWAYCFRAKVERVTADQLMGFFGTDSVVPPLVAFGFLEAEGDGEFRVKGTGRYTTLAEKRSEAGKAGRAKQLASRTPGRAGGQPRASAEQVPSKHRASAEQVPSKHRAKETDAATCPPVAGQKRALDPRSEISSPNGEERSRRSEDLHRAREETATGSALGGPASAVSRGDGGDREPAPRPRVPRVPPGHYMLPDGEVRPVCVPGTPEWADAERRGDWAALGWTGQA